MDIKWKSIKFSTKKLYAIISPFLTIKQQITFKKSKNRFLAVFLHFSQKIVISRYKRHGYQMKELKILYKKGLSDHVAILSHQAANRVWKFQKSIFVGFLHFSQKIVILRYKRHRYEMKEHKILYKKGLPDHIAILNHWATNHVWKVKKSIFVGFLHYTQKIVISRYKRHGYQMKGLITPFCMTIFMLRCLFQK